MRASLFSTLLLALTGQLASAGVVITKISQDQIVDREAGDCFFGVVTPQGCGYVFLFFSSSFSFFLLIVSILQITDILLIVLDCNQYWVFFIHQRRTKALGIHGLFIQAREQCWALLFYFFCILLKLFIPRYQIQ